MTLPPHIFIGSIDARAGECRAAPQTWLSAAEQDEFASWRNPNRRVEWLAGRWLLKEMIFGNLSREERSGSRESSDVLRLPYSSQFSQIPLRRQVAAALKRPHSAPAHSEIEILSRDVRGRGRPPCVLAAGRALPFHLSLAHAGGRVWAALSTSRHHRIGIDVVRCGSFRDRAMELWFTQAEQGWLQQGRDTSVLAVLWAAKEAVYKATNRGEPFVPALIEIGCDGSGRYTWLRDGVSPGPDDLLLVRRTAGAIFALAVAHAACANSGVRHD